MEEEEDEENPRSHVVISVQQRNGKKHITTVTGLAEDLDLKKILKYAKRYLKCNGAILSDAEFGEVITLTGNQKEAMYHFLIEAKVCTKNEITVRGY